MGICHKLYKGQFVFLTKLYCYKATCECHNLMSKTLPCNRVKILHCLGYSLPVHYILLLPATFYQLNVAVGIMQKKFGLICNIIHRKYTPDKTLGTLLFIIAWSCTGVPCHLIISGLAGTKIYIVSHQWFKKQEKNEFTLTFIMNFNSGQLSAFAAFNEGIV